jgi:sugar lactone lactonase YvrE
MAVFVTAQQSRGAAGDLYEADYGSGSVFRYTVSGAKSTFVSGLANPSGLAFDPAGNLFVADAGANLIYKVTPAGAKTVFASGLNKPFGLAFDSNGNLYEGDNGSGTILKFSPTGQRTTFAAGLSGPAGLAIDASNNIYEADFNSNNIFKFTTSGIKNLFASGLSSPDGIYVDRIGNVLDGDVGSGHVNVFASNGSKIGVFASFFQPTGVTKDAAGDIFVSDNGRGTITKITASGSQSIVASGLHNPQYLAFEPATGQLVNISTRAFVATGNNVSIGGFIISGTQPKLVLIRGLGPTLSHFGVTNPLADPTLELHNGSGALITSNNDWQSAPNAGQIPSNLRPPDPHEAAILITLPPGNYTAIEAGNAGGTGVGLVEIYDLNTGTSSQLANISTRGLVETGEDVMIGGFVASGGNGVSKALIRALGPTLRQFGITNPLPDPTLRLVDANGHVLASNNNWKDTQQSAIQATGLAPSNDLESAILISLPDGAYTAIVADKNGATGIGLVEVYHLP